MNNHRKKITWIWIVTLLLLLLALIAVMFFRHRKQEKLHEVRLNEVHRSYQDATSDFRIARSNSPDRSTTDSFHKHWLEAFEDALAKSSANDPARQQVLSNILALQTALGKYDEALQTSRFIVESLPSQKKRMLFNDSEIALTWAYSGGKEPPDLKSALPYYEKAWPVMKEEKASPIAFSFYQKYGDLLKDLGSPEKAVEIYYHGYEKGLESAPSAKPDAFSTFSPEWFLDAAMQSAYASGDAKRGTKLFEDLINLPGLYYPPSSYFYEMSGLVDPERRDTFQQLSEEWLHSQKADDWTPKLRTHLATSYFKQNKYQQAAKIYTSLMETPFGRPSKADTKTTGYKPEILFNLACSLYQLGEKDEAFKLFHSFAALYKDDSRVKLIPQI